MLCGFRLCVLQFVVWERDCVCEYVCVYVCVCAMSIQLRRHDDDVRLSPMCVAVGGVGERESVCVCMCVCVCAMSIQV